MTRRGAVRTVGTMTATKLDHRATIMGIYEAFGRGDLPAILEVVAEKTDWGLEDDSVAATAAPFVGRSTSREQVAEKYFGGAMAAMEFNDFRPDAVAVDGDQVVCVIYEDITARATGKRVACHVVHPFTMDAEGRIARYRPIVPAEWVEAHRP